MEHKLLIKEIRLSRGMSQADLAQKANVKQAYISQLERNHSRAKSPTLRIIFRIAAALEVCPHLLVQYNVTCNLNCCHFCEQNFLTQI